MAQGMNGAWIALGVAGAVAAAGAVMGRGGSRAIRTWRDGVRNGANLSEGDLVYTLREITRDASLPKDVRSSARNFLSEPDLSYIHEDAQFLFEDMRERRLV
jgi:hypothetical protein